MKNKKRFAIWNKFSQVSCAAVIEITGRRPGGGSKTLNVKVTGSWSGSDGYGARLEDLDTSNRYVYIDGKIVAGNNWRDVWLTSIQKITVVDTLEF